MFGGKTCLSNFVFASVLGNEPYAILAGDTAKYREILEWNNLALVKGPHKVGDGHKIRTLHRGGIFHA